jgi:hypothetical protein
MICNLSPGGCCVRFLGEAGEGRIISYESVSSPGRKGTGTQCMDFVFTTSATCATNCAVTIDKKKKNWLDCSVTGLELPAYTDTFTPTFTCNGVAGGGGGSGGGSGSTSSPATTLGLTSNPGSDGSRGDSNVGGSGGKSGGSNTAAVIGGVFGGVAFLLLIAALVVFLVKRGKTDAETAPPSNMSYGYPSAGATSYPSTGVLASPTVSPVPAVAAWASAPTTPPALGYPAAADPGYNQQPVATPPPY